MVKLCIGRSWANGRGSLGSEREQLLLLVGCEQNRRVQNAKQFHRGFRKEINERQNGQRGCEEGNQVEEFD